jgi:CP family cyanate transporter-like MFS transporter
MSTGPPISTDRALLAGLFLCALPLRGQIVAIGPLLPDIRSDLRLSHAVAGLLVSIPVVCMGVFARSTWPTTPPTSEHSPE